MGTSLLHVFTCGNGNSTKLRYFLQGYIARYSFITTPRFTYTQLLLVPNIYTFGPDHFLSTYWKMCYLQYLTYFFDCSKLKVANVETCYINFLQKFSHSVLNTTKLTTHVARFATYILHALLAPWTCLLQPYHDRQLRLIVIKMPVYTQQSCYIILSLHLKAENKITYINIYVRSK